VPQTGCYVEILNSDSAYYGGGNVSNAGALDACEGEWMNRPANLEVTIPPLAVMVLRRI
jgi:1,4-alpha-glucan branching enzyme